VALETQHLHL